jgi:hypothetical protein
MHKETPEGKPNEELQKIYERLEIKGPLLKESKTTKYITIIKVKSFYVNQLNSTS